MQTKLFRQQHGEILRALDHVDGMCKNESEQTLCSELARLAGIVKLHLALEDKNLYPAMHKNADAQVRATAEEYQRTMGNLAPHYIAFHEKWIGAGAIAGDRAGFIKDFLQIRDALRTRIDLENRNLYDVVDQKVVLPDELAS